MTDNTQRADDLARDLQELGARRRENGLVGRDSFAGFSRDDESRYHKALNAWAHGGQRRGSSKLSHQKVVERRT